MSEAFDRQAEPLKRGWTTGTCAAGAAKAAFQALATGVFPDPVEVPLPGGQRPAFALAVTELGEGWAKAGIIKDAGDDPDVTHGAMVLATVRPGPAGAGVAFKAGPGVGTVTRPGLALVPGEPAINPVPRQMIRAAIGEVAASTGRPGDVEVEISIPGGEEIARRTLNGRLGIVGGLSILGTSGIVIPYSCASWIASIHRGIDVARAIGIEHIAAATGTTSEAAVKKLYGLAEPALIDMGDFAGGTLKYLRTHPVKRLSIAGGIGKMTKLAQGLLDLHSKRGSIDLAGLAERASAAGGSAGLAAKIIAANTAAEAFGHAAAESIPLGDLIAAAAWKTASGPIAATDTELEVIVFDRDGQIVGRAPFKPARDGQ